MIVTTLDPKVEATMNLENPVFAVKQLDIEPLNPDPGRGTYPMGPVELNALTYFPEVRISTQIKQIPDRCDDGKKFVSVDSNYSGRSHMTSQ